MVTILRGQPARRDVESVPASGGGSGDNVPVASVPGIEHDRSQASVERLLGNAGEQQPPAVIHLRGVGTEDVEAVVAMASRIAAERPVHARLLRVAGYGCCWDRSPPGVVSDALAWTRLRRAS